jgi:hypothetical protein
MLRLGALPALVLFGGCHGGPQTDIIERELRCQEEQIYALQDNLMEYRARLDRYKSENARLRRDLATGKDSRTPTAPELRSPAPPPPTSTREAEPASPSRIDPPEPPELERDGRQLLESESPAMDEPAKGETEDLSPPDAEPTVPEVPELDVTPPDVPELELDAEPPPDASSQLGPGALRQPETEVWLNAVQAPRLGNSEFAWIDELDDAQANVDLSWLAAPVRQARYERIGHVRWKEPTQSSLTEFVQLHAERGAENQLSVTISPRSETYGPADYFGEVSLLLKEPGGDDEDAKLARWDFDVSDVAEAWTISTWGRTLKFDLTIPENLPADRPLELWVRLTREDGAKILDRVRIVLDEMTVRSSEVLGSDWAVAEPGRPSLLHDEEEPLWKPLMHAEER